MYCIYIYVFVLQLDGKNDEMEKRKRQRLGYTDRELIVDPLIERKNKLKSEVSTLSYKKVSCTMNFLDIS